MRTISTQWTDKERKELVDHLSEVAGRSELNVSLEEAKALVGYNCFNIGSRDILSYGKVTSVHGSRKNNVNIDTNGGSNHFKNLKYVEKYNLYADYPYSMFLFIIPYSNVCGDCTSTCKDKEVETCPFQTRRTT